jgi:hypothetical protein
LRLLREAHGTLRRRRDDKIQRAPLRNERTTRNVQKTNNKSKGKSMHKNLKVKQETHEEFKKLAQDKGVMFDAFLKSLMNDYKIKERIKELESLRAQGA